MAEKKQLNQEELEKVSGGEINQTWEEIVAASKNWLPEGNVTCKFCSTSFNAKENAFGFTHVTYENGMTETRAVAKCPNCGMFWCN